MADGINLTIYKNGESTGLDITQLVESIKWAGRRGSPSRTLTVNLLDDDGYRHERSGIDVEEGWQCLFKYNDAELFRGIFMTQGASQRKTGEFKAYDNGIYLSNNRDTFVYESKTAADVFRDVCTRFGLPVGSVASCSRLVAQRRSPPKMGGLEIAPQPSILVSLLAISRLPRRYRRPRPAWR